MTDTTPTLFARQDGEALIRWWSVYEQTWHVTRAALIPDREWAAMSDTNRAMVERWAR